MSDKTLIMMVGLPRSGKSTYAKNLGFPVVCPDQIRLALHGQRHCPPAEPMVWAIAKYMVRALFGAGHDEVVLDATNYKRRSRDEWRSVNWTRKFIHIQTPTDKCIQRAHATAQPDLVPVIERMAGAFEPVSKEEGELHVVAY